MPFSFLLAASEGLDKAWTISCYGDQQEYKQLSRSAETQSYQVIAIRSLTWPGAVTVF